MQPRPKPDDNFDGSHLIGSFDAAHIFYRNNQDNSLRAIIADQSARPKLHT
jgi:hypothetical protein